MKFKNCNVIFFAIIAFMFFSTAAAGVENNKVLIYGEYSYAYGDNESLSDAKEICKKRAIVNALESTSVFVHSTTTIKNFSIENDEIYTVATGYLKNIRILEERVNKREIYFRISAIADIALLENMLNKNLDVNIIIPQNKYKISFYSAKIDEGLPYSYDDSNPAPDSYILLKDKYGNIVFHSGNEYLQNKSFMPLLQNRNNYNPDFRGVSFNYVFQKDSFLLVYLMDWDGFEGFLGSKSSPDDIIGSPYKIAVGYKVGRQWIKGDGWELEVEIIRVQDH